MVRINETKKTQITEIHRSGFIKNDKLFIFTILYLVQLQAES